MITNFLQYAPFSATAIAERTPYVRGLEITKETARYKFGGDPMAEYLGMLGLDGTDEDTGSVEWDVFVMRFGKRIVLEDDRGFVWVEKHETEEDAKRAFNRWESAYWHWLDQEDDEQDETDGPWCETHNRPHVPGDLACELTMAENVVGTDD